MNARLRGSISFAAAMLTLAGILSGGFAPRGAEASAAQWNNGNYIRAEVVRSFLISGEYRGRFGN